MTVQIPDEYRAIPGGSICWLRAANCVDSVELNSTWHRSALLCAWMEDPAIYHVIHVKSNKVLLNYI